MAANTYKWVKYVDDCGNVFAVKANSRTLAQAAANGAEEILDSDTGYSIMPRNMRARVAYVWDATLKVGHKVVCYTKTATLYCSGGVAYSCTTGNPVVNTTSKSYGHEGERVIYSIRGLTHDAG